MIIEFNLFNEAELAYDKCMSYFLIIPQTHRGIKDTFVFRCALLVMQTPEIMSGILLFNKLLS